MSDDMKELATVLHQTTCHFNHTDQCGWFYETKESDRGEFNWEGWTHKRYLEKAEKLYSRVPQRPPAIIAVLRALTDL
jgi:hypothetical protein